MKRRGSLNAEELEIVTGRLTDNEAFEKFYHDCRIRNLRPATIQYYKDSLHTIQKVVQKEFVECDQSDIERFITEGRATMNVTSINTRLRALRAFYNFLVKNKYIKVSPMKNVKLLRDRHKTIETLTNDEIQKLIKTIRNNKSFITIRDEVILLVFLDTGIRLSELVGIELEDIGDSLIIIRKTKNNFERTVFISDITQEMIKKYLLIRGKVPTNKLFVNQDNGELKAHSIQTRFTLYGSQAGIKKRVSPHTFRHTMAMRMIVAGVDAFTLMILLGHTDITITKRYVNLWGIDLKRKHQSFGALNGLTL